MILKIKNFQSCRKADLTLKGFTVIKGATNNGNSLVRRAISSLLYPNTFNKNYIRYDAKTVEVALDNISMVKGKGKNIYKIDGKELPKAGRNLTIKGFKDKDLPMWSISNGLFTSTFFNRSLHSSVSVSQMYVRAFSKHFLAI